MTDIDNLDEFLNKTKRIEELKAANNLRGELLNLQASRIAELEKVISDIQDSIIGYEPEHATSCCHHISSIIVNFYKCKDGAE